MQKTTEWSLPDWAHAAAFGAARIAAGSENIFFSPAFWLLVSSMAALNVTHQDSLTSLLTCWLCFFYPCCSFLCDRYFPSPLQRLTVSETCKVNVTQRRNCLFECEIKVEWMDLAPKARQILNWIWPQKPGVIKMKWIVRLRNTGANWNNIENKQYSSWTAGPDCFSPVSGNLLWLWLRPGQKGSFLLSSSLIHLLWWIRHAESLLSSWGQMCSSAKYLLLIWLSGQAAVCVKAKTLFMALWHREPTQELPSYSFVLWLVALPPCR